MSKYVAFLWLLTAWCTLSKISFFSPELQKVACTQEISACVKPPLSSKYYESRNSSVFTDIDCNSVFCILWVTRKQLFSFPLTTSSCLCWQEYAVPENILNFCFVCIDTAKVMACCCYTHLVISKYQLCRNGHNISLLCTISNKSADVSRFVAFLLYCNHSKHQHWKSGNVSVALVFLSDAESWARGHQ